MAINPANWSTRRRIVTDPSKVSGSSAHSNFPVLIMDGNIPNDIYDSLQTGEIAQSFLDGDSNLKAYYRFESGNLTVDSSGNSHTLTAISDPAETDGKFGGGVELDGNDAYSITDHADLKPTGNFSVGAWVRTNSTGTEKVIFQSFSFNPNFAGWRIYLRSTDNMVVLQAGNNTGGSDGTHFRTINSGVIINDAIWHQIICTFSGTTAKIYVDGILSASLTHSSLAVAYGASNNVRVGCVRFSSTDSSFFIGDIDDVFILASTTLTDSQIKFLYHGGADLRITTDSTGDTEVPFEIVNLEKNAPFGNKALSLTASSSQYASISDASQTGLDITNNLTVSFWVKYNDNGSLQTAVSKWNESGVNQRGWAAFILTGGILRLNVSANGTSSGSFFAGYNAADAIKPGTWTYVAWTFASGTFKCYVNGVESTTSLATGATATSIYDNNANFSIGSANNGGLGYLNGQIKNVRVFNDVRSGAEIVQDMSLTSVTDANLQGEWNLENAYTDSSGNGNNLTASNSPAFSQIGKAIVWAKTPSLSYNTTTPLYLWSGNADAESYEPTATYGRNNVWTDYNRVYHNQISPTSLVLDSSGNLDGTLQGTWTGSELVAGKIGNGYEFNLTSDKRINIGDTDTDFGDGYSFSAWFKADQTSSPARITEGSTDNNTGITQFINSNSLFFRHGLSGSFAQSSYAFTDTTNLRLLYQTWDGTTVRHYLDDSNLGSVAAATYGGTSQHAMGGRVSTTQTWDGIIDEMRFCKILRSADWITTEFDMQNDPSTFWIQEEEIQDERDAKISGLDTDSSSRNSRIVGEIYKNDEKQSKIYGTSSVNNQKQSKITGVNNFSADYIEIEFTPSSTDDDDERGAKAKGSAEASSEKGLKIIGKDVSDSEKQSNIAGKETSNSEKQSKVHGTDDAGSEINAIVVGKTTDSSEKDASLSGKDFENNEKQSKIHGVDFEESERQSKISGKDIDDSEIQSKITGQETESSLVSATIHGKELDSSNSLAKIKGSDSDDSSRESSVVGKDSDSSERGSVIYGEQADNAQRSSRLTGKESEYSEKSSRITGFDTDSEERQVRVVGKDSSSSERQARISGTQSDSSDKSAKIIGSEDDSNDRQSKVYAKDSDNDEKQSKTTGQLSDESEKQARIYGIDTEESSRGAKVVGLGGVASNRSAKIQGIETTEDETASRLVGEIEENSHRQASVSGTDEEQDVRSAKTHGKESLSQQRSSKIVGKETDSDEISSKTHGKDAESNQRQSVITGELDAESDISSKISGKNTESSEVSAKSSGKDADSSETQSIIYGKQTDDSLTYAKIVGSNPDNSEKQSKISGRDTQASQRSVKLTGVIHLEEQISAKASILKEAIQSVFSRASITTGLEKTVVARANILAQSTRGVFAKARILKSSEKTIFSIARIVNSFSESISATARIRKEALKDVYAKASILSKKDKNVFALARIVINKAASISSRARIISEKSESVFSIGRILKSDEKSISALARISIKEGQSLFARAFINTLSQKSIFARGRIVGLDRKTLFARAFITYKEWNIKIVEIVTSISGQRMVDEITYQKSTTRDVAHVKSSGKEISYVKTSGKDVSYSKVQVKEITKPKQTRLKWLRVKAKIIK